MQHSSPCRVHSALAILARSVNTVVGASASAPCQLGHSTDSIRVKPAKLQLYWSTTLVRNSSTVSCNYRFQRLSRSYAIRDVGQQPTFFMEVLFDLHIMGTGMPFV